MIKLIITSIAVVTIGVLATTQLPEASNTAVFAEIAEPAKIAVQNPIVGDKIAEIKVETPIKAKTTAPATETPTTEPKPASHQLSEREFGLYCSKTNSQTAKRSYRQALAAMAESDPSINVQAIQRDFSSAIHNWYVFQPERFTTDNVDANLNTCLNRIANWYKEHSDGTRNARVCLD